jgi:hypothetical protein
MKWRYTAQYPLSAAEVLGHFTDREFQERKLAALGGGEVIDYQFDGRQYHLRSRRRVSLEVQAPAFIAKALGKGMAVLYDDRWDIPRRCGSVGFEFPGIPVQVGCSTQLRDNAQGCEMSFDWEIKAKVPVVGGQVEKLLVSDLELKLGKEVEVMRRLMAGGVA